jgi:competence protein ComEC
VESAFRTTGIAHLLAVSGLHVSIIALLVSFVLKLFKVSKMTNFGIMFVLLLFYSYLCDFSVSVLRASIMTLFLLYLRARGKCYDSLTALSISLCLILIIDPLKLFNVSLILSFMAVLSIILMLKVFEALFEKCFHKKISGSLALIFAVQVGLVLVQLYFFNNYSVMSLICNFISVPIATIAFVLLILGTVVSAMIPFMSFICLGYDYLMGLVVKFNYTISKAGFVFSLNNFNFLVVILGIMLLLFLSDYIFIKKRYKAIGASVCLILSSIMIFV